MVGVNGGLQFCDGQFHLFGCSLLVVGCGLCLVDGLFQGFGLVAATIAIKGVGCLDGRTQVGLDNVHIRFAVRCVAQQFDKVESQFGRVVRAFSSDGGIANLDFSCLCSAQLEKDGVGFPYAGFKPLHFREFGGSACGQPAHLAGASRLSVAVVVGGHDGILACRQVDILVEEH